MTTNADLLTAEARALERAIAEGVHVFPMSPQEWVATTTVEGRSYLLNVTRHNVRCNCPAGRYGRICKHAAQVRHVRSLMLPPRPTGHATRRSALTPAAR
jgi:hypothetical protein